MLTASTHIILPALIGRDLTDEQARNILMEAQTKGVTTFVSRGETFSVVRSQDKYTVGKVKKRGQ